MDNKQKAILEELKDIPDDKKIDKLIEYANKSWRVNELEKSEALLQQANSIAKRLKSQHSKSRVLGIEAKVAYSRNMLDQALEKAYSALKIQRKLHDNDAIGMTLNNIGVFYSVLELNDKALEYFLESNTFTPEDPLPFSNAGEIYERKGEYQKALDNYMEALSRSYDDKSATQATIFNNLGSVYAHLKDYKKSLEFHLKGYDENEKRGVKQGMITALLGIGKFYLNHNEFDTAKENLDKAMKIAEEIDNNEYRGFCLKAYIDFYEKIEDYKNLSFFLRKQLELREKVFFSKFTRRFLEIEAAIKTEKKELEAKQLVERSSRLASIGVMAAGITHEINQPLNAIKVSADSMLFWDKRNPGKTPGLFVQELKQISKGATRIDEIIRHMRSFWVTPDMVDKEIYSFNKIISNALSLIDNQIKTHGIDLKLNLCRNPARVQVNRTHAEQIVINLVTNALHALDNTNQDSKYIALTTICNDKNLIFAVEDNGVGVSPEYIDKIFDPFYSTRKPGMGMGLGLAIVKQYLDEMKGEIQVRQREKGGAIFEITLPISGCLE